MSPKLISVVALLLLVTGLAVITPAAAAPETAVPPSPPNPLTFIHQI
jgi:hypothetical protein